MKTSNGQVEQYLARLRRISQLLPPEERQELINGITEHFDSALSADASP